MFVPLVFGIALDSMFFRPMPGPEKQQIIWLRELWAPKSGPVDFEGPFSGERTSVYSGEDPFCNLHPFALPFNKRALGTD